MLELQISHSLCTDCIAQVKLESQLRDAEAELARLTASKTTEYRALNLLKSATEAEVQQLRCAVKGKRKVQRLYCSAVFGYSAVLCLTVKAAILTSNLLYAGRAKSKIATSGGGTQHHQHYSTSTTKHQHQHYQHDSITAPASTSIASITAPPAPALQHQHQHQRYSHVSLRSCVIVS